MDSSEPASRACPIKPTRHLRWLALGALCALLAIYPLSGCADTQKQPVELASPYPKLPPRQVPEFMKGTIFEQTDVENRRPYLVSGYGLVVGLNNTGSNDGVPMAVRNYMYDQMVQHGFGGTINEDLRNFKPGAVLADPRTSIVEVYGFLPPGARKGQRIDIFVRVIDSARTTSLAHGQLYATDLRESGVDPIYPRGGVNIYARARGPIFVTPTYVATTQPAAQASLRSGMVLGGGIVQEDRPLSLRVRMPQISVSMAIQDRIRYRFQDNAIARTQDEGLIYLFVPRRYNGDWQHFIGVATHLYMSISPGSGVMKARELVKEALKPDAFLQDISYCWEGIGDEAIPAVQTLYGNASPDVAFVAARAGAFLGDTTAVDALAAMAGSDGHPFALNAAKVLGELPEAPKVTHILTDLLSSKNTLVRVGAYEALAAQKAPSIMSRVVRDRFIVDRVVCNGEPMIYATCSETPRIAIFGENLPLKTPILFSALGDRFTISSSDDGRTIAVFDRSSVSSPAGTQARMQPDLYEMIRRLGGDGDDGFDLAYSDLVGILQSLAERKYVAAGFVLQDQPNMQAAIEEAPPIPAGTTPAGGQARPDTLGPVKVDTDPLKMGKNEK